MDLLATVLAVIAALAVAWVLLVAARYLHRRSRELVGPALRMIPDLVRLVRALLADPSTPRPARLALVGLLGYLLLPIDLVPDLVPVLGSADDVVVAALVLRWVGRRVGVAHLRRHWSGSEAGFEVLCRLLGT